MEILKIDQAKVMLFFTTKINKIYSPEEVAALPNSTTENILGKGNSSWKDVMAGFSRRKINYRPEQAKDAINYK